MTDRTLVVLLLLLLGAPARAQEAAPQKAILVTGASSGIGRAIAERLAAEGHWVYAGARKDSDLAELDAIENIQGVRLDVTIDADIEAAVETVQAGGRGLYGVVNNAGVVVLGPLIEVTEEDLDFQFGVNVYGPWRITKAFAPMIIESKGRITTISSISGVLAGPLLGVYAMSKHAVEAYTDALAGEMERFGVHVSAIEPGNYRSEIGLSAQERMAELGYSADGSLYEEEMKGLLDSPMDRARFKEPDEVADAVVRALFDENPGRRYMTVPNEREARFTIRHAFRELVQLNQNQAYKFDRDQLVEMLDELIAEVEGGQD